MGIGRRIGLRGRAIAFCVLLILGTVGSLSTALILHDYHNSIQVISRNAGIHARSIGLSVEAPLLLNDVKAMGRLVRAAASDESIKVVQIVNRGGEVVANCRSSFGFDSHLRFDPARPMGDVPGQEAVRLERTDTELLVVSPIWSNEEKLDLGLMDDTAAAEDDADRTKNAGPIGYVRLTYGLDQVRAEMVQNVVYTLVISVMVVAFGIVATIIAIRRLLTPVNHLAEATRIIADGDFSRRATETGAGEIGELAQSFNHMADRLQKTYSSIERKVVERTAELVRANKAKDDFLANMSHEIRTPMTAILGFSESLKDATITDAERTEAIKTIQRSGKHLLSIINDILDISKIEAGRMEIEKLRCSPHQIVAEVASAMRVKSSARGLVLSVEYLSSIPETIETDPIRLRQILINLIGNAVKFTKQGSVRLCVQFSPAEGNGDDSSGPLLQFEVIDTGIGMPPEHASKIFKPFTQADETMTRRFGGTGLGLSISKRLVEMLGGTIEVESELGRGSTFRFTIATGDVEGVAMIERPSEVGSRSAQAEKPAAPSPGELNCRILLAEDGPDNQRLISYILKKAGAEVVVAENGKIALEQATQATEQGQPFDVILMDMQMPVMDGYQATGALRRNGYQRPIIALTAHAMAGDREKCINAGCDEYLTKPVNRKKLLETVQQYASGRTSVS